MCTRSNFYKRGCEISIKFESDLEKKRILMEESMIGIAVNERERRGEMSGE